MKGRIFMYVLIDKMNGPRHHQLVKHLQRGVIFERETNALAPELQWWADWIRAHIQGEGKRKLMRFQLNQVCAPRTYVHAAGALLWARPRRATRSDLKMDPWDRVLLSQKSSSSEVNWSSPHCQWGKIPFFPLATRQGCQLAFCPLSELLFSVTMAALKHGPSFVDPKQSGRMIMWDKHNARRAGLEHLWCDQSQQTSQRPFPFEKRVFDDH